MITLSSHDQLRATKGALENFQNSFPGLFEKLVDVVSLTRALQFKYQYMGCLLMDEDAGYHAPNFVQRSVLRLYKRELQSLKDDQNFKALKQILSDNKEIGYAKISQLVLGTAPESLLGASIIK
jgi:hypothetical protein